MISSEQMWALLADFLLIIHIGIVFFIVGGLLLIWLGAIFKWRFVRNRVFRYLHLGLMGIVLLETVVGMICPLTEWEAALRERAGQQAYGGDTFMQYWLQQLLYWDWSPMTFMAVYALVFAAILIALWVIPPGRQTS